ncbi:unnamed protein product [Rotaria sp. Silwood1]|nr:unnamed protein product [Rotaria sp. Silwood1]CAF4949941.1 unnamed protein product [Rotaria sp. Silwood1]
MQYVFTEFLIRRILPSSLIVSNKMIPNQIRTFFSPKLTTMKSSYYTHVHQLSLIDCNQCEMGMINWYVNLFSSLQSFCLVESMSKNIYPMAHLTHEVLREIVFDMKFTKLTEIKLMVNDGMILDKQLHSNLLLKRLTISLRTIDDLFVLLDGLVANLIELDVTLCTGHASRRLLLPFKSNIFPMVHLTKFLLTTKQEVEMRSEYLFNIVKFLSQIDTLIIDIKNWIHPDYIFVQGHQIEMIIDQFMPRLQHFYCYIRTECHIDMTTFVGFNQRWQIACGMTSNDFYSHLYTVPWSFKELKTSMLANEDTMSICPNVLDLTVDKSCSNLSQRFPKINTLTVLCKCEFSSGNFPRLRHLTIRNIEVVSMIGSHIHTLTLIEMPRSATHSSIYTNILHLILDNIQISSLQTIMVLVRYFPNLCSLKIQFEMSKDYFDSLDVLLDHQHLPHLMLLKTNWINENNNIQPEIKSWIIEKTILKWRSKPFLAFRQDNNWIVWL